jgi:molybdenum cofactor biosynthesis enzyme MoaA
VADEIESYVRSGVRDVAFYDDALLLRAGDHLLEILRILEDRRVRARFHAPNGLHVRMITPEVARALRAGGFETLRLSFETASETRQKDSGGKVDSQDLRTGVETLLAAGFARRQMEVYIMFGLPGQHVGEVVDTIAFVHTCGGRVKLVQFSPIPGTPEFERSATAHPALRAEPLLQNKTAFHQLGGPLGLRTYEALKLAINTLNAANDAGRTLGGRELSRALRFLRTEKGSGPRQEAGGRQTPFAQDH